MKTKFLLLFLLFTSIIFAQDDIIAEKTKIKPTFIQFDLAFPFSANEERTKSSSNGNNNDNWFIPNGLASKFGYGIQKGRWVALSLHTGIDWFAREKLVATPIFGNLRLSPHLGNDTRLVFQMGYGKGFALGRGNLQGKYQKFSLGIETAEDLNIFIEGSTYGFKLDNTKTIVGLNIGLSLRTF